MGVIDCVESGPRRIEGLSYALRGYSSGCDLGIQCYHQTREEWLTFSLADLRMVHIDGNDPSFLPFLFARQRQSLVVRVEPASECIGSSIVATHE